MVLLATAKRWFEGKRQNARDCHIGDRIRTGRIVRGVTGKQLAQALKCTNQQLNKYELGTNRVSLSRLFDVADALRLPVAFFLEKGGPSTRLATSVRARRVKVEDCCGDRTQLDPAEALDIIRAFSRISDARLRKSMLAVMRLLGDPGG